MSQPSHLLASPPPPSSKPQLNIQGTGSSETRWRWQPSCFVPTTLINRHPSFSSFYKMHTCCWNLGLLFNLLLKYNYNQTIDVMHYVIIISVNICISYRFIWFNFLIVSYLLLLVSLSNYHKTIGAVCILLDLFTHLPKDPVFYHYT